MYGVCVSVERRERVDRRNKSGPLVWGGGGGGETLCNYPNPYVNTT